MKPILIGGRTVGPGCACFVIAEAGVNHNGDPALARRLIEAAAQAGADAVKFQTFDPEALAAPSAPKAEYQRQLDGDDSQLEMLRRLELPKPLYPELQALARSLGLIFFSSPFDLSSADFLEQLGVPTFKIPSGELPNHPFLRALAQKGRPLLLSTGMCTLDEVREAVEIIDSAGAPLALFHCVSSYPAAAADANLRAMDTLRRTFEVPVGWSDHTEGTDVAVAAAALGADLLEKHLTLDRSLPGPDHRASLEPGEFARMVRGVKAAGAALGDGIKAPRPAELAIARVARKSLHWRESLSRGTLIDTKHLIAMRPGTGVSPARTSLLVGRRLRLAVVAGTQVNEADLDEPTGT